jgi:hypothetical protein
MDDPAVTAKQLVDLAAKHIEDQQCRIVRQGELMAKYERDGHAAPKLTVDEASVEKVVRDTHRCSLDFAP